MKQYILALLLTMLCPALFYGQDTYFTYQSGENELRFRLLDDGTVGLVGRVAAATMTTHTTRVPTQRRLSTQVPSTARGCAASLCPKGCCI